MGRGGTGIRVGLVALAIGCAGPFAGTAWGLEPGVHVDPGSPAAKEYALPLNQARQTGSEPSSHSSSEGTLFGAGIKPPGAGGSPRSPHKRPGASGRGAANAPGTGATAATGAGVSGGVSGLGPIPLSQPALAEAMLRAARAQGSAGGDGSILALLGGGVAVLVLGGFGGTVLRHSRRRTSSP
jgi:hypothetical protein